MKTKVIIAGAVLAAFLMLMVPCISAVNVQATEEEIREQTDFEGPILLLIAAIGCGLLGVVLVALGKILDVAGNGIITGALALAVGYILLLIAIDIAQSLGLDVNTDLGVPVTLSQIETAKNCISGTPDLGFTFTLSGDDIFQIYKEKHGID